MMIGYQVSVFEQDRATRANRTEHHCHGRRNQSIYTSAGDNACVGVRVGCGVGVASGTIVGAGPVSEAWATPEASADDADGVNTAVGTLVGSTTASETTMDSTC